MRVCNLLMFPSLTYYHSRQREEMGLDAVPAAAGPGDADGDGYVSPEFDLPTTDEEDMEEGDAPKRWGPVPVKRSRLEETAGRLGRSLEDDEELALRLLRGES